MTADAPKNELEWMEFAIAEAQAGRPRVFIERYLIIRDEGGNLIPFHYNRVQSDYDAHRSVRDIKNKPRKIGFSTQTLAEFYTFAITIPEFEGMILHYDSEEAAALFRIIRRFHDNLPDKLRPTPDTDRSNALGFPVLNSIVEVQTAGGRRKGRGRTPSALLIDEFAHYDDSVAEEIYTSIVNSMPIEAPIVMQSTPNGVGNKFYSTFVEAINRQNNWRAHFYPWMFMPEKYALPYGSSFALEADQGEFAYTNEEDVLINSWNAEHPDMSIGMDNIRWRRLKISEQKERFKQEFPEDPISCFIATTETVLDTIALNKLIAVARKSIEQRLSGNYRIWRKPASGQQYCIGVDCGEGIQGRDNSVAIIGTNAGRVDAVISGIYGQTEFAQLVHDAAIEYNLAFVLNERQGAFTFQHVLYNNLGYKNVYKHREGSKNPLDAPLGLPTTGGEKGSKMRMIEQMRTALQAGSFLCEDLEVLRELVEFKRQKDGSYGAPAGSHDDKAMASMLYLLACDNKPTYGQLANPGRSRIAVHYPEGVFI